MIRSGRQAFTIVELLIVIVVIGILAAITIAVFTGAQERAKAARASADISGASRKLGVAKTQNGSGQYTADLLTGDTALKVSTGTYRLFTVCANAAGNFASAAELTNGDIYYSISGGTIMKDNSLNTVNPCPSLGITTASTVYAGMPTASCAAEAGTCTFTGTQTIAYGSVARGQFIAMKNQTSPVACSNAYFTDPSPGYTKACYVLQY